MANWVPNEQGLNQLTSLFSQSLLANQRVQQEIYQKLNEFHKVKDYNNYLVYIFCNLDPKSSQQANEIRVSAGLSLKNNLKYYDKFPEEVKIYIKQQILRTIADPSQNVRKTAGTIVASIARLDILDWPDLIENLTNALDSKDGQLLDGVFLTLSMIFEDCSQHICDNIEDNLDDTSRSPFYMVLNILFPKLIYFLTVDVSQFRLGAIQCLNPFLELLPEPLENNFSSLIQGLLKLAEDPSPKIRVQVCRAFITASQTKIKDIIVNFEKITYFMLLFLKDSDEDVALEACEFWNVISHDSYYSDPIYSTLPRLVPILLDCLVYSVPDQYLLLQDEEEDSHIPDKDKDINPGTYYTKYDEEFYNGSDEEEEEEDEGKDDFEEEADEGSEGENPEDTSGYSDWNIRKCAALTLESLASLFENKLTPIFIEAAVPKLAVQNHWTITESAILAFGAVAVCCSDIQHYLPRVLPYLLQQLSTPTTNMLVKNSACWAVSKYSHWIVEQDAKQYLEPYLYVLLQLMVDKRKKVQSAACSSLSYLLSTTRFDLILYFDALVSTFVNAFTIYQLKNRLVLYDILGIFTSISLRASPQTLPFQRTFAQHFFPILIEHWNNYDFNNKSICTLANCLQDVTRHFDPAILHPVTEPMYYKCLKLMEHHLQHQSYDAEGLVDTDFFSSAFDLIGSIARTFKEAFDGLISNSPLLDLLSRCCALNYRQLVSTLFTLLGDLFHHSAGLMAAGLHVFIPSLLSGTRSSNASISGNSCWALAMVVRFTNDQLIAKYAPVIFEAIDTVLDTDKLARGVIENAGVCLGMIALKFPNLVAENLSKIFQTWCFSLRRISNSDGEDKYFTIFGLLNVVELNSNAIFNSNLTYLCDLIAVWCEPTEELARRFFAILQKFKTSAPPDGWAQFLNSLSQDTRVALQKYNI